MKQMTINRGDIFWVELDPARETEIKKTRPCLVISCDEMNEGYNRVIVAPITSNTNRIYSFDHKLQDHSHIKGKVMFHQIRTVDKSRIGKKVTSISIKEMNEIDNIIKFILGVQ